MNEIIKNKLEGLIGDVEINRGQNFIDYRLIPMMPIKISVNVSVEMVQDVKTNHNPIPEEIIDGICSRIKAEFRHETSVKGVDQIAWDSLSPI